MTKLAKYLESFDNLKRFLSSNYFKFLLFGLSPFVFVFVVILAFNLYYLDKIYPGIHVSGISVGGMTKKQAAERITQKVAPPEKVTLIAKDRTFELSLKEVGLAYDVNQTLDNAYLTYRSGNLLNDYYDKILSLFINKDIDLITNIDDKKLSEYLQVVSNQVTTEARHPSVYLENDALIVDKGSRGDRVDIALLKNTITLRFSKLNFSEIPIPFYYLDDTITDAGAETFKRWAEKYLGKSVSLTYDSQTIILNDSVVLSFLKSPKNENEKNFNSEKILEFIKNEVTPKVNHEPQNAVFKFDNGKVAEFSPAKDGVIVNEKELKDLVLTTLTSLETADEKTLTATIPVQTTPPKITTDQVNDLGIKELLGRGSSKFRGSIAGRVHNIGLASSKFNGTLVGPGETFSFNDIVGDVSSLTGYKQAYIIRDGRTVLGDGGGVCQVSTTLFRAALKAGLPIIERRAHSYRVGYYEQESPVGIDATVFAPTTDFKFKNDTPGHILIQTVFSEKESSLAFEIYGTNDGRIATTTKPVTTGLTPPPEDLYVDDPTLPLGVTKQVDYKAWGAKVSFNYKVERSGETIFEKSFISNYRPWQAVFLRGTGPTN